MKKIVSAALIGLAMRPSRRRGSSPCGHVSSVDIEIAHLARANVREMIGVALFTLLQ